MLQHPPILQDARMSLYRDGDLFVGFIGYLVARGVTKGTTAKHIGECDANMETRQILHACCVCRMFAVASTLSLHHAHLTGAAKKSLEWMDSCQQHPFTGPLLVYYARYACSMHIMRYRSTRTLVDACMPLISTCIPTMASMLCRLDQQLTLRQPPPQSPDELPTATSVWAWMDIAVKMTQDAVASDMERCVCYIADTYIAQYTKYSLPSMHLQTVNSLDIFSTGISNILIRGVLF
jgi:hypothetical protein